MINKIRVIVFLFFLSLPLWANGASYVQSASGMCYLIDNSDIEMISEDIYIDACYNSNLKNNNLWYGNGSFPPIQQNYDCNFTFKNTSATKTKTLLGFPFFFNGTTWYSKAILLDGIININFYLDGKPVNYKTALQGSSSKFPKSEYPYDFLVFSEIELAPNQEIQLRITYTQFEYPEYKSFGFHYIVKSGLTWKNAIGRAHFKISLHGQLQAQELEKYPVYPLSLTNKLKPKVYEETYNNWIPKDDYRMSFCAPDNFVYDKSIQENPPFHLYLQQEVDKQSEIIVNNLVQSALTTMLVANFSAELVPALDFYQQLSKKKISKEKKQELDALCMQYKYTSMEKALEEGKKIMADNVIEHYREFPYFIADLDFPQTKMIQKFIKIAGGKTDLTEPEIKELQYFWGLGYRSAYVTSNGGYSPKYNFHNDLMKYKTDIEKILFQIANCELYKDPLVAAKIYQYLIFMAVDYVKKNDKSIKNVDLVLDLDYLFYPYSMVPSRYSLDDYQYTLDTYLKHLIDLNNQYFYKTIPGTYPIYNLLYNIACSYSLAKKTGDAAYWLKLAFQSGFPDRNWPWQDEDLKYLRDNNPEAFKYSVEAK